MDIENTNTATSTESSGSESNSWRNETIDSYRQDIMERAGVKSYAEFHPEYKKIEAKKAARRAELESQRPQEPVVQDSTSAPSKSNDEVEKLRLELAELKGRYEATNKPVEKEEDKPAPIDPTERPYFVAATRELGEDAPDYLLADAEELIRRMEIHRSWFTNSDSAKVDEHKRGYESAKRSLVNLKREADKAREMAELKAEINRLKNPSVEPDFSEGKKIALDAFDNGSMAKYHPNLDHAVKSKLISKEKITARLDKISAKSKEEWIEKANDILSDLNDLYPEPPRQDKKDPVLAAKSRAPIVGNGYTTKTEAPKSKTDYSREMSAQFLASYDDFEN